MPDHDLVAAPFVKRYFTTGPASIVAPIVTLPIVSVVVEAVWSDAEARDFGFGRDSIPGGCRERAHIALATAAISGNFPISGTLDNPTQETNAGC